LDITATPLSLILHYNDWLIGMLLQDLSLTLKPEGVAWLI